jgi:hypothetical protein
LPLPANRQGLWNEELITKVLTFSFILYALRYVLSAITFGGEI